MTRGAKLCAWAVAAIVGVMAWLMVAAMLSGCATGPQAPDTWNYTVSVDHQTGETTSYMGVSGPLKWRKAP